MFQMGCKNLIYFSQVVKRTATLQCYGLLALVVHQSSTGPNQQKRTWV